LPRWKHTFLRKHQIGPHRSKAVGTIMRHADFYTGGSKLLDAIKTLRGEWHRVEAVWRDAVRDDFEKTFLEPLDAQTLSTIEAATRMAEILSRAKHECS
jgi:hypothetical protein